MTVAAGPAVGRDSGFGAECTVVVPTLATTARAASLDRAIASVRAGNATRVAVVVVVNGDRFDPRVVDGLRRRSDIELVQIPTPSLSAALDAGRRAVRTPFFGFVDDDDEYLPGAVDRRLDVLRREPGASLIASNGVRRFAEGPDRPAFERLADVPADPIAALFRENWLASCGALFRADLIGEAVFADVARYLEWSWLAFVIAAQGHRVAVLDEPTFVIHDSAVAESKSEPYLLSQPAIFERMLRRAPSARVRAMLRTRRAQALHAVSVHHLAHGRRAQAWGAHLSSLAHPAGWKFASYTRHLLMPARAAGRP